MYAPNPLLYTLNAYKTSVFFPSQFFHLLVYYAKNTYTREDSEMYNKLLLCAWRLLFSFSFLFKNPLWLQVFALNMFAFEIMFFEIVYGPALPPMPCIPPVYIK